MKPGTVYRAFNTKTGLHVILRAPRKDDLNDLYTLHRQLIEEDAMIGADTQVSMEEMITRHEQLIQGVESDMIFSVIADIDGVAVGQSNSRKRGGRLRHNAGLGVFLLREYRNMGIGTELIKELETQVKEKGVKILYLEVFAISPAVSLYKRLGYREYGRLPRAIQYKGDYVDCISMYKNII